MSDSPWYVLHDGQRVGPLTVESLQQLIQAGLVPAETVLVDPSGSHVTLAGFEANLISRTVATSITAAPPAPPRPTLAPPPPPPLPSEALETADPVRLSIPWNPQVIGWLGLLFSPVWSGMMAALNGRRLGMGTFSWRPVSIGFSAYILYLIVSNLWMNWYPLNLGIYLGAVWLIWQLELQPQIDAYERHSPRSMSDIHWFIPILGGLPCALAGLFVFAVQPLLPLSPREVCDEFVRSSSLSQAKRLTTENLWPALTALDQLAVTANPPGCELLEEGPAPAEVGGHAVAFRGRTAVPATARPLEGQIHLLERDGHWKIEDVYLKRVTDQGSEEWTALSRNYEDLMAAGETGRALAAILSRGHVEQGRDSELSKTFSRIVHQPGTWIGLKALFTSAGIKKAGLILVALIAGFSALFRTKK